MEKFSALLHSQPVSPPDLQNFSNFIYGSAQGESSSIEGFLNWMNKFDPFSSIRILLSSPLCLPPPELKSSNKGGMIQTPPSSLAFGRASLAPPSSTSPTTLIMNHQESGVCAQQEGGGGVCFPELFEYTARTFGFSLLRDVVRRVEKDLKYLYWGETRQSLSEAEQSAAFEVASKIREIVKTILRLEKTSFTHTQCGGTSALNVELVCLRELEASCVKQLACLLAKVLMYDDLGEWGDTLKAIEQQAMTQDASSIGLCASPSRSVFLLYLTELAENMNLSDSFISKHRRLALLRLIEGNYLVAIQILIFYVELLKASAMRNQEDFQQQEAGICLIAVREVSLVLPADILLRTNILDTLYSLTFSCGSFFGNFGVEVLQVLENLVQDMKRKEGKRLVAKIIADQHINQLVSLIGNMCAQCVVSCGDYEALQLHKRVADIALDLIEHCAFFVASKLDDNTLTDFWRGGLLTLLRHPSLEIVTKGAMTAYYILRRIDSQAIKINGWLCIDELFVLCFLRMLYCGDPLITQYQSEENKHILSNLLNSLAFSSSQRGIPLSSSQSQSWIELVSEYSALDDEDSQDKSIGFASRYRRLNRAIRMLFSSLFNCQPELLGYLLKKFEDIVRFSMEGLMSGFAGTFGYLGKEGAFPPSFRRLFPIDACVLTNKSGGITHNLKGLKELDNQKREKLYCWCSPSHVLYDGFYGFVESAIDFIEQLADNSGYSDATSPSKASMLLCAEQIINIASSLFSLGLKDNENFIGNPPLERPSFFHIRIQMFYKEIAGFFEINDSMLKECLSYTFENLLDESLSNSDSIMLFKATIKKLSFCTIIALCKRCPKAMKSYLGPVLQHLHTSLKGVNTEQPADVRGDKSLLINALVAAASATEDYHTIHQICLDLAAPHIQFISLLSSSQVLVDDEKFLRFFFPSSIEELDSKNCETAMNRRKLNAALSTLISVTSCRINDEANQEKLPEGVASDWNAVKNSPVDSLIEEILPFSFKFLRALDSLYVHSQSPSPSYKRTLFNDIFFYISEDEFLSIDGTILAHSSDFSSFQKSFTELFPIPSAYEAHSRSIRGLHKFIFMTYYQIYRLYVQLIDHSPRKFFFQLPNFYNVISASFFDFIDLLPCGQLEARIRVFWSKIVSPHSLQQTLKDPSQKEAEISSLMDFLAFFLEEGLSRVMKRITNEWISLCRMHAILSNGGGGEGRDSNDLIAATRLTFEDLKFIEEIERDSSMGGLKLGGDMSKFFMCYMFKLNLMRKLSDTTLSAISGILCVSSSKSVKNPKPSYAEETLLENFESNQLYRMDFEDSCQPLPSRSSYASAAKRVEELKVRLYIHPKIVHLLLDAILRFLYWPVASSIIEACRLMRKYVKISTTHFAEIDEYSVKMCVDAMRVLWVNCFLNRAFDPMSFKKASNQFGESERNEREGSASNSFTDFMASDPKMKQSFASSMSSAIHDCVLAVIRFIKKKMKMNDASRLSVEDFVAHPYGLQIVSIFKEGSDVKLSDEELLAFLQFMQMEYPMVSKKHLQQIITKNMPFKKNGESDLKGENREFELRMREMLAAQQSQPKSADINWEGIISLPG